MSAKFQQIPLPSHYSPARVSEVWRVPYQQLAGDARKWAGMHELKPSSQDTFKIHLFLVDVQNTFCIPGFELFVGGNSGTGALDDNRRLCEFIYRNLASLTAITATMDTHLTYQIFHQTFWVDAAGNPPPPYTLIALEDVAAGKWRVNPQMAVLFNKAMPELQAYADHYVRQLSRSGKYTLTIWPFHALLGGIGHAIVSAVEEAIFFHSIARVSRPAYEIKGDEPFTEHYSVIKPEVMQDEHGRPIGRKSSRLMELLQSQDVLVIAGQAKSHCVAFTVSDLLEEINQVDPKLAGKVFLLEDCSSPVVIPGVVDYTQPAAELFAGFAKAGMHMVKSTTPIDEWF